MSSLELFLATCQLEQYYSSFLNAGATDHDLPDLLELNEQELNEMIHAVKMLPFHSIKFKKALREHRSSSTPESMISSQAPSSPYENTQADHETNDSQHSTIVSHAIIYGKNSSRPLTNYEKAINQASIEFALQDPSLLIHKGKLFDLAKKKLLEEGYQYKRGKSRSKFLSGASHLREDDGRSLSPPVNWTTPSPPLSPTLSLDERKRFKRKQYAIRQSTERRLRINQLEMDLAQLRSSDHDSLSEASLVKTIAKLKAQERKHQWYKRKTQDKSESPPPTLPSPPHLFLSPPPSSDFYFRPLSPPSEIRAKVLTVRDCCNA